MAIRDEISLSSSAAVISDNARIPNPIFHSAHFSSCESNILSPWSRIEAVLQSILFRDDRSINPTQLRSMRIICLNLAFLLDNTHEF